MKPFTSRDGIPRAPLEDDVPQSGQRNPIVEAKGLQSDISDLVTTFRQSITYKILKPLARALR